MIFGHGIDLIEVSRIKKAVESSEHFKNRVFTKNEIIYCESMNSKYQSYAVRFAAKEAFLKALGTGWSSGISWTDIEVLNMDNGKPYVVLYSIARKIFDDFNLSNIFVSLSHIKEIAYASVIIEYFDKK